MSLDTALSIATSGLRNINAQLTVVSNNVANAGTAGYAVETQQQSSLVAADTGMGVFTGIVVRGVDLQQQSDVMAQNGVVSFLQTTQSGLQPIAATQGTVGAGNDLASLLGNLQDGFSTLANDTSNVSQQAAVVDSAQALAGGINRLAAGYGQARQAAQNDIVSSVNTLNAALGTIGALNQQIVTAQSSGQSTADLANLRDTALLTISGLLDVRVAQQSNGAMRLTTASGLSLPTPGAADAQNPFATTAVSISPVTTAPSGGIPAITLNGTDVTTRLQGGQLGADIALRDTTLPTYQAELDQFSQTLASRFSGQGLELFTQPDGTIPASGGSPTQQNYIGFANSITVNPVVQATPALVRDGTVAVAGSATGAASFTPNPAGGPAGFETLVHRVLDYAFGAQAQANVAQPAIPTSGLGAGGTIATQLGAPQTLADFASSLVAGQAQDLGHVSGQLANEQAVQTTLNTQLQATTGVNIDSELAKMLQLQNAYGANAKVLSAVQAMFNQLIAAVT